MSHPKLENEISKYVKQGYRVVSKSDNSAQLVKPKRFSLLWASAWFLLFGIGLIFYLFYFARQKDQTIYLSVDDKGHIKTTRGWG